MPNRFLLLSYFLPLALWVGGMVFFSFVATPALFARNRELAGEAVGIMFPPYYLYGYVAGGLALAALLLLHTQMEPSRLLTWSLVLLILAFLFTVVGGQVLLPKAHAVGEAMRAAGETPELRGEFGRLHGLSMLVNLLALLAALAALLLFPWIAGVSR